MRLDSLAIAGLETVAGGARLARDFPLRRGAVFDRNALEAGRDTIITRLRDSGYPAADATVQWGTDSTRTHATAAVQFVPGPFTRLGRISIIADTTGGRVPKIPDRVVRGTLGLRSGDTFSARDIVEAQRTLYQTDAYRRVDIRVDTTAGAADSVANLIVTLAEGDLHAARVSAGWATLDCFRTQGDLTSYYFLPRAQRLEFTGRVSRIGIGDPLGGVPALCPQARGDLYSDKLNYYVGATVRQPSLFRLRRVPSLTLFTSRASEYNAFRRTTAIGALFSLDSRPGSRLPSTLTYQLELGRTTSNAAVFCAVFSACDDPSRDFLARSLPLGAVGYALAHNGTDDPLNPTRGSLQRMTLRHSSAFTGSDPSQRFNKAVVDASWYWRLGGVQWIAHVQGGALFGAAPPQERLYAGGPTTVRGFRQNELGPVVYLLNDFQTLRIPGSEDVYYLADPDSIPVERTIPAGGNSLAVANLEAQFRSPLLPQLLSLAVFTDAGTVWDRDVRTADERGPRFTPGAGVRIRSPFGAIRIDLGYNPYDPIGGAAYYITPARELTTPTRRTVQELYCVSPGNALRVRPPAIAEGFPVQERGSCAAEFRPRASRGFFRRLNPSIWIGQAF